MKISAKESTAVKWGREFHLEEGAILNWLLIWLEKGGYLSTDLKEVRDKYLNTGERDCQAQETGNSFENFWTEDCCDMYPFFYNF